MGNEEKLLTFHIFIVEPLSTATGILDAYGSGSEVEARAKASILPFAAKIVPSSCRWE